MREDTVTALKRCQSKRTFCSTVAVARSSTTAMALAGTWYGYRSASSLGRNPPRLEACIVTGMESGHER